MDEDGEVTGPDSLEFHLTDADVTEPLVFDLTALELDSDVEVGVRAPLEADHTVDEFPAAIHEELQSLAEDALDWERLEAEVGENTLLDVANLSLDPLDDAALKLSIHWNPGFRR